MPTEPGSGEGTGGTESICRVEVVLDAITGFDDPEFLKSLVAIVDSAAESTLNAEHVAGPDNVTVLLSDDRKLRDLNRQFNDEDSVTDVLSFNDVEGWHNGTPPPNLSSSEFDAPGETPRLGEIAISLEQTKRQAAERSVPFERELAMLVIHGVLHLLGYDHAEPEDERVMFSKTDAVLERISVQRA